MENPGVDENIAQGPVGSDLDGYESSSSEEDVFASKKGKKGRGAAKTERGIARNILQYIAAIYCSVAMQYCNDCAVSIATIVHVPLNRNTESKKRLANGARAAQE